MLLCLITCCPASPTCLPFCMLQISVMQEMLASLGPQIEEAAEGVSNMMQLIEQVSHPLTITSGMFMPSFFLPYSLTSL